MGITKQGGQNMASLLEYKNVEISFGGTPVVRDFNVSLQPGEILGLVGESGSGKSTIIKAAMGLLGNNGLVTKGDIFFEGKNIPDLSEKELRTIRGAKIGMIFQDAGASLCPIRTIGEQIYESMSAHGQISKAEAKEKALDLFDKLHFKNPAQIWDSYPFEMSGGMNQRAGIAIAMLMNPSILLADEPTSALDVSVQKQVVMEMLQLREMFGMAIILVTHDIGVVSAMADRILVLKDGNTMEYGNAADILNHPQNDYTKKLLSAVPRLRRC
jgi:ABC-type dipeptide/oligopeptide/nickel transport system ATPase component